jgi:hypothetical protein
MEALMPAADRMRVMRARRAAQGLREIRLVVPDAGSALVKLETQRQVVRLDAACEQDAMDFIEAVSVFGDDAAG